VAQNLLSSTIRQADMTSAGCGKRSLLCTCRIAAYNAVLPSRLQRGAKMSTSAAMLALQIATPKCALCWSTYAGLINASWFAATAFNPTWMILTVLTATLSLGLNLYGAWRTRRYASLLLTIVAWSCFAISWIVGSIMAGYAGIALLIFFCARDIWRARSSNTVVLQRKAAHLSTNAH